MIRINFWFQDSENATISLTKKKEPGAYILFQAYYIFKLHNAQMLHTLHIINTQIMVKHNPPPIPRDPLHSPVTHMNWHPLMWIAQEAIANHHILA